MKKVDVSVLIAIGMIVIVVGCFLYVSDYGQDIINASTGEVIFEGHNAFLTGYEYIAVRRELSGKLNDDETRIYHVNKVLALKPAVYYRNSSSPVPSSDAENMKSSGKKFVKKALKLEGINKMSFEPYKVAIEKGKLFKWEDFESEMVKELFTALKE